jgi:cysteine desulfurase family protein (TIGR01976 family)
MTTLNFLLSEALAETMQPGDEIVVTDLDHDSNVAPWLRLAARGIAIRRVPLLPSGELDMDVFHHLIGPRTRLVAVGWASNALGTVNPIAQVRQWTHEVGALLLVDAVHWAPHGVINLSELSPDFLLCSAYKFFGPHIGILYTRAGLLDTLPTLKVRPQSEIGPERIETGTLNHAALAGVSAAIAFIASLGGDSDGLLASRLTRAMRNIYDYEHSLARDLYEGLAGVPGVSIYGPAVGTGERAPTISFTLGNLTAAEVSSRLGHLGILAWDGDFYAVTAVESLELAERGGLVRLGLAPYNTAGEIGRTVDAVRQIAQSG